MSAIDDDWDILPECDPLWAQADRATVCRKQLLAAGYLPIPVNGKAPPIQGWSDIQATDALIERWATQYATAMNTGIICINTPAIDIDVSDSAVADELQHLAERMIGPSPVRIGRAPKRALIFRTDKPFKKISTPVFTPLDSHRSDKIEVLSWGQQIVVNGIHPDTGRPYTCIGIPPGTNLPRSALTSVTAEKAAKFITAATQCMLAHGWTARAKIVGAGNGHAAGKGVTERAVTDRERLYASAALSGCADELVAAARGARNDILNRTGLPSRQNGRTRLDRPRRSGGRAICCCRREWT
jgi:hypothetical protein